MSIQCKLCGAKLFGAEIEHRVCEYCALDHEAVRGLVPENNDDDDDRPRMPSLYERRRGGPAWKRFKSGLNYHMAGAIVTIPAALLFLPYFVGRGGGGEVAPVSLFFVLVAAILWLVGSAQLCTVPRHAELSGFAWGNLASQLVAACAAVMPCCLGLTMNSYERATTAGPLLMVGGCSVPLLLFVSAIFYVGLLNGTARYYGENTVGRSFIYFIVTLIAVIATIVLGVVNSHGHFAFHSWIAFILFCALLSMIPILYLWFFSLIVRVRGLID